MRYECMRVIGQCLGVMYAVCVNGSLFGDSSAFLA
jgi:hypothetical protein